MSTSLVDAALGVGEIEGIQFGIFSAEEIRNMAVCEITNKNLEGEESVYDARLGTLHSKDVCVTCGMSSKLCPGHFGVINLNQPVFHPLYSKIGVCFLKCFCSKCFKFLLTKDHLRLDGLLRFTGHIRFERIVDKIEKIEFCFHCDTPKPKIVYIGAESKFYMVFKKSKDIITDEMIQKIFDNISDDDVRLLGFDPKLMHPRNTIITALPVIPTISRPYVITDSGKSDDDLTTQYHEIIKCNKNLETETNEQRKDKLLQTLKFRIRTLFNNSKGKAKLSNGKALKAFKERISGKDGIIRNNLMGKRVNQSGRTVIGPDPTIRTNELVVPDAMAATLTKPERVAAFNLQRLQMLLEQGKVQWVVRDGIRHNMKYAMYTRGTELRREDVVERGGKVVEWQNSPGFQLRRDDVVMRDGKPIPVSLGSRVAWPLKIGDEIHRQLLNGDIVLLNRQPTLHNGSMLAKSIVIRPGKTLRFALATAKTFNADFDGDEMNIHVPQDVDATAELMTLSSTKSNMFSSQASKSNLSIVMDALLASYLMTKDDTPLRRDQFFQVAMHGDGWSTPYILEKVRKFEAVCKELGLQLSPYSGKGLISLMLPDDFFYSRKNDAHPTQPTVRIYKGIMVSGALTKAMLGASQNALHQLLYKDYGADVAMTFLDNIQFIGSAYLLIRGFSIGISDCVPKNTELIEDEISKAYVKAKQISESISHPRIREARIREALSNGKNVGQTIAKKSMDPANAFIATVSSGSKGDFFNIAQITGVVGQNDLGGGRIPLVINSGRRTLPHYRFEETDIEREFESRGFIKSSFMQGLNAREVFLHAMSGREGVSDTAMKTAKTGYTQRKMVKMMEDLQVKYDGTVRNSYGSIVQWAYGEDGFDRSQTVVLKEEAHICDVSRIAERLNMKYRM